MGVQTVRWLSLCRIALALIAVIAAGFVYLSPARPATGTGVGQAVGAAAVVVAQPKCVFVRPSPLVLPGASTVTVGRYSAAGEIQRHPRAGLAIVSDRAEIAALASSMNELPRYPCPMPPCSISGGSYLRLDFEYAGVPDIALTIEDGGCGAVYLAGYDDPVAIAP